MIGLTGCGTLFPKPVEFFQDKVQKYPEPSSHDRELQRRAAQRAEEKAKQVVVAAVAANVSPSVLEPAKDTARLTEVVSQSLGPPVIPASVGQSSEDLAKELRTAIAKFNRRLDEFKMDNNENAGKKIEGTGLFSVPYFVWIGLVALLVVGGWLVLRTIVSVAAAGSPPVAIGLKAAQVGGRVLSRGFSQLVKGGEDFKSLIEKNFEDADTKKKILAAFMDSHKQAQDADVRTVIEKLKD